MTRVLFKLKQYQKIILPLLIGIIGYGINLFDIHTAYGVSFVFGGIATGLSILFLGPIAAAVTATIASSYTLILWHHPYAMTVWVAEALFLSLFCRRSRLSLTILDLIYWILLGIPLLLIFYHFPLANSLNDSLMIAFKQMVNAIFNISAAKVIELIWRHWCHYKNPQTYSFKINIRNLLHEFSTFFLISVCLIFIVVGEKYFSKELDASSANLLHIQAIETGKNINYWLDTQMHAVKNLAEVGGRSKMLPSSQLQNILQNTKDAYPNIHNVYLANKNAVTYAFYPALNERGESTLGLNFSDRTYFQELKKTLKPVTSEVFQGRGGVFLPIFTISVPIVKNEEFLGYALAAIKLSGVEQYLHKTLGSQQMSATIVDQNDQVIASTFPNRVAFERLALEEKNRVMPYNDDIFIRFPYGPKKNALIKDWKNAYFVKKINIENTKWSLILELPVAPRQATFFKSMQLVLILVVMLFVLLIPAIYIIGGLLTLPLRRLASITRQFSEAGGGLTIEKWPHSTIEEITTLVDNFQYAQAALLRQNTQLKKFNHELEEKVEIRTQELSYAEEKYRSLFQLSQAVMLIVNPEDCRILDANEAAVRFYGWPKNELIGQTMLQISTDKHEKLKSSMAKVLDRHKEIIQAEHCLASGQLRNVEIYASLIDYANNQVIFAIIHDVTDKKQSEKIIEQQRVNMLAASRLSLLGEMASGIAHEINNPLTIIGGDSVILEKNILKLPPEYMEKLLVPVRRIEKTVHRISKIIHGLKAFSRSGEHDPMLPANANALVESTLTLCEEKMHQRGIKLDAHYLADTNLTISCRETQIAQVLMNLLSNAMDAVEGVPQSQIIIEMSLQDQKLVISITDNGTGVPPEVEEKMLMPFYTTKEVGKGTGLGLSISKGIIDSHNGKLYLDRSVEKTKFVIELPINQPTN